VLLSASPLRYDGERYDGERCDGKRYDGERYDGERYDGERCDGDGDGDGDRPLLGPVGPLILFLSALITGHFQFQFPC
jgi:hypothetical protein